MTEDISKILTDVLTALYRPFWLAVILAVLNMFFYLYLKEHGGGCTALKEVVSLWKGSFVHSSTFRRLFVLSFYTGLILFRTLLDRDFQKDPLFDVIGPWALINEDGELVTDIIENLMLFIPFSALLLWAAQDKVLKGRRTLGTILLRATQIVFVLSFSIEVLQLILRLGTFQLSDIFFNTLGGTVGGFIYWVTQKFDDKRGF